ncbi:hypothetical protein BH10PSE3_BH10PSE3_42130 [soil metagenome]
MEIPRFRSIGEVLYEMALWLLFYPRTLWRVLLRPAEVGMIGADEPGAELVSPPLFLMISILVAHALDLAMRAELGERGEGLDIGLLVFRVVGFSLFPLVMAVGALKREGRPVDRQTLRGPFYLQCLYAAPFAISVSVAAVLARDPAGPTRMAAAGLILAAVAWYLCVETRWLRSGLAVGRLRAFGLALRLFGLALSFCLAFALLTLRLAT